MRVKLVMHGKLLVGMGRHKYGKSWAWVRCPSYAKQFFKIER